MIVNITRVTTFARNILRVVGVPYGSGATQTHSAAVLQAAALNLEMLQPFSLTRDSVVMTSTGFRYLGLSSGPPTPV